MKRILIIILGLFSVAYGQLYQQMPQAGYGPVKRFWIDSVLSIPTSTTSGSNLSGGRDVGRIRYNISDSSLQVYTGNQWLSGNRSSGWGLTGNASTDASTNFIGTTDGQDLVIKTNNTRQLTVNVNGALGIGSTPDYGTSGYLLKTNGSGSAPSYISQASVAASLSSLVAATASNSIDNGNNAQVWQFTGISQYAMSLDVTTTAATTGSAVLFVDVDGANASANRRTHAGYFRNTHTGSTSTNVAGYFSATGGTNNFAIIAENGNVGIGTISPAAILHTVGTVRMASLGSASTDTTTYKPVGINSSGYLIGMTAWPQQVTASSTTTFTNKRWTARVGSTTSSATPTINTDNVDIYKLTAQAADITSFTTNLSGTPVDGDILEIQITGTAARAITWGSSFVSTTVTLPATTVTTTTLTVIFQYYTTSSYGNNKWHVVNYY